MTTKKERITEAIRLLECVYRQYEQEARDSFTGILEHDSRVHSNLGKKALKWGKLKVETAELYTVLNKLNVLKGLIEDETKSKN